MKYIYLLFLAMIALGSCQEVKIGCLEVKGATYSPYDTMLVRKELNQSVYADRNRFNRKAPWVTTQIQGVVGTDPISYSLYDVKASDGGDAEVFKQELIVRGGGVMEVPFVPESPNGKYVVSLKVEAGDYSAIIEDVFAFVIRQK